MDMLILFKFISENNGMLILHKRISKFIDMFLFYISLSWYIIYVYFLVGCFQKSNIQFARNSNIVYFTSNSKIKCQMFEIFLLSIFGGKKFKTVNSKSSIKPIVGIKLSDWIENYVEKNTWDQFSPGRGKSGEKHSLLSWYTYCWKFKSW